MGFIAAVIIFTGGVYASQWLSFTGDEQMQQSDNNVEEIMQILRDTHSGKLSAESALAELEELNPKGLAKLNKEQREKIEQLNNEIDNKNAAYDELQRERDEIAVVRDNAIAERDNLQAEYDTLNNGYTAIQEELTQANEYIEHLEAELSRANEAVANHAQSTNTAVEEARTYK